MHREEEARQFRADLDNRKLLWHGSRITNWTGILSQVSFFSSCLCAPVPVPTVGGRRVALGESSTRPISGSERGRAHAYSVPPR